MAVAVQSNNLNNLVSDNSGEGDESYLLTLVYDVENNELLLIETNKEIIKHCFNPPSTM